MKLLQTGTFDVSNYGDLLFPLLARHQLASIPGFNLQVASPIGGAPDMTDCEPCVGILDIIEDVSNFNAVLVGGGNILHCMPSNLAAYKIGMRGKVAYGDLWIGPAFFIPKDIPILWNAPGVPNPIAQEHKMLVAEVLRRVNYLSVRDEMSRQYLVDVWPEANIAVVPDSAWMVNHLWTTEQLTSSYEEIFRRMGVPRPHRSVVIHLNRRYVGNLRLRELAERLDRIGKLLEGQLILIAIGRCHGDHVFAKEVSSYMASSPVLLDAPRSLQEITACISHAVAYVGSSMHGSITASAFGVPGVCVASQKMVKFGGIIDFIGHTDVLAEEWDEAIEILSGMDFNSRKVDLLAVRDRAHSELQMHWNHIHTYLRQEHSNIPIQVNLKVPAWRKLVEYQTQSLGTLVEIQNREQEELRSLKRKADRQIQQLQVEIERMHNSLVWKAARPIRWFAQRFPRMADWISHSVRTLLNFKQFILQAKVAPKIIINDSWRVSEDIVAQVEKYRKSSETGKRKIVLFTAIFGQYDKLFFPDQVAPDVDYICFTDCPRNNYGVWQLRSSPYYHPDPTRIARYIKTHPHELFPDHQIAVWIDANIILREDIHKFIDIVRQGGNHIGLIPHPVRNCFYEEAKACKRLGKDNSSIINAQIKEYRQQGVNHSAGLHETGFIVIFLEDKRIQKAFGLWWLQIERFSRRDQLALCWVTHMEKLTIEPILSDGKSVRDHEDFHYFFHENMDAIVIPDFLFKLGAELDPLTGLSFAQVKQKRLEEFSEVPLDIIVCVHNALEDVRVCLASVKEHLLPNHRIILVNDYSNEQTTEFLREFTADCPSATLLENEGNLGYTRSANRGLAAGTGEFRILLNSDTIVCRNWSLKMLAVAFQSSKVGIVGPLSNAASSQSIPNIHGSTTNTAINPLPENLSPQDLDIACEDWSFADLYPEVPLVHGFCFGIKKKVIDHIGFLDDANFDRFYGEENDYCFRASSAGFQMKIATHTFVYHRKSASIEEEVRLICMKKAGKRLREMYGAEKVKLACLQMEHHPLLERMRCHAQGFFKGHD